MTSDDQKAIVDVKLPGEKIDEATAEVIRVLAGDTAKGVSSFVGDIFGGLVGDRIRQWRKRNLLSSLEKTANHVRTRGIDLSKARKLPELELLSLFEGASKEENASIQELWAGLIANSLNVDGTAFETSFRAVLEQITSIDARVIQFHVAYLDKAAQTAFEIAPINEEINSLFPSRSSRYFLGKDSPNQQTYKRLLEKKNELEFELDSFIRQSLSEISSDKPTLKQTRENLLRMGVMERNSDFRLYVEPTDLFISYSTEDRSVDGSEVQGALNRIAESINESSEFEPNDHLEVFFRANEDGGNYTNLHQLTGFGDRFVDACGIRSV